VKRNGAQFSSEPFNLKNVNTFKYSGLANPRAVGVTLSKDGKSVELHVKHSRRTAVRKSSHSAHPIALKKHTRNHTNYSAELIKQFTSRSYFRSDLTRAAIARYHALHRSLGVKADLKKETRRKRRGAAAKLAAA